MITYTKFPNGRLGNAIFEYCMVRAMAIRNNRSWSLPEWKYAPFFKANRGWSKYNDEPIDIEISEPNFDFHESLLYLPEDSYGKNISLFGYWQSEFYFKDVWNQLKEELTFEESFLEEIKDRMPFQPGDNHWAVHLRCTDYLGNSNYHHLSPEYYLSLFDAHPENEYVIYSDDVAYIRFHFSNCRNIQFIDKLGPIKTMAVVSTFKNHVIANSSFSWWAAMISSIYHKVNVIRPDALFEGKLKESCTGLDFYPSEWTKRDSNSRIDLKDVTFIIPVKMDSKDRKHNVDLVLCMLQKNFDTNIIVMENGGNKFEYVSQWVKYTTFKHEHFHRTKMLNLMAKMAQTSIIVNYDADVLFPPGQILAAVDMIRNGGDFAYPYWGEFFHVNRQEVKSSLLSTFDAYSFLSCRLTRTSRKRSYGGAVVMNKESFFKSGGENENFVSHAPEDTERAMRWKKLGFKVERVLGALYHLDHWIGPDSDHKNIHKTNNKLEYEKVRDMSSDELREYVNTWSWVK